MDQVAILDCSLVESSIVNTHPHCSIFLLDHHYGRCKRVGARPYMSHVQKFFYWFFNFFLIHLCMLIRCDHHWFYHFLKFNYMLEPSIRGNPCGISLNTLPCFSKIHWIYISLTSPFLIECVFMMMHSTTHATCHLQKTSFILLADISTGTLLDSPCRTTFFRLCWKEISMVRWLISYLSIAYSHWHPNTTFISILIT